MDELLIYFIILASLLITFATVGEIKPFKIITMLLMILTAISMTAIFFYMGKYGNVYTTGSILEEPFSAKIIRGINSVLVYSSLILILLALD